LKVPGKTVLALVALFLAGSSFGEDQTAITLSLQQALKIALEKNPERKAVMANTKATHADVQAARSLLMPRLMFSETATRGNDSVYVFGSRLRQRRFTSGDFALNQLNTPFPLGNFATKFAGNWNLFDSFASWHAVSRAQSLNDAATQQLARADQEIAFKVIDGYERLALVRRQLEVAEQSLRTALAIADRSQARFEAGLVVESDPLSAKVRVAAREQDLIRAKNNVLIAQAELNTAIGLPLETAVTPTNALAERDLPVPALAELEKTALDMRPDLKQIQSEETAQRQSVSIAKSSFGPRVNAYASWESDNPTFLAGGGGNNWVGGIELQLDIFQGGAKRAQLARERALEERVTAMKQAANNGVRLEVRRAFYELDATRQQLEVARAAITQAKESMRMNQDRYEGGLTTITEILSAEEALRRSQVDYWEAVYRLHSNYASLELASGTLTMQSPLVTP